MPMTGSERLIRVEAPHFVAALIIFDGKCVAAAPILRWAKGKGVDWLRAYFEQKGWKAYEVKHE